MFPVYFPSTFRCLPACRTRVAVRSTGGARRLDDDRDRPAARQGDADFTFEDKSKDGPRRLSDTRDSDAFAFEGANSTAASVNTFGDSASDLEATLDSIGESARRRDSKPDVVDDSFDFDS